MHEWRGADRHGGFEADCPYCHGGWYAIADEQVRSEVDEFYAPHSSSSSFADGADKLAKTLGFEDRNALKWWASNNALIWGNTHGMCLFADSAAFGVEEDEDMNLQVIVDHWEGVLSRLEESTHNQNV